MGKSLKLKDNQFWDREGIFLKRKTVGSTTTTETLKDILDFGTGSPEEYSDNITRVKNAINAKKSVADESGNNIKETYANSLTASDATITLNNKNGTELNHVTVNNVAHSTTAGTATNLADNPSLQKASAAVDEKQIKVIAGNKTSTAFTVPYATQSAKVGVTEGQSEIQCDIQCKLSVGNGISIIHDNATHTDRISVDGTYGEIFLPRSGGSTNAMTGALYSLDIIPNETGRRIGTEQNPYDTLYLSNQLYTPCLRSPNTTIEILGNLVPVGSSPQLGTSSYRFRNGYISDLTLETCSGFGVNGNINPLTDEAHNLGAWDKKFNNIYCKDLHIDGIHFRYVTSIDISTTFGDLTSVVGRSAGRYLFMPIYPGASMGTTVITVPHVLLHNNGTWTKGSDLPVSITSSTAVYGYTILRIS